jgi:hypothetical protein
MKTKHTNLAIFKLVFPPHFGLFKTFKNPFFFKLKIKNFASKITTGGKGSREAGHDLKEDLFSQIWLQLT